MKKSKNAKVGIIVALLLLVVGFAAVSANLDFTGWALFTGNADEFDANLRFVLDTDTDKHATIESSTDKDGGVVSVKNDEESQGKVLDFTTPVLDVVGESVTVKYYVENYGQYDAKFTKMTCSVTSEDNTSLTNYIEVTPGQEYVNQTVKAATADGATQTATPATITVKLKKTYAEDEEARVNVTCKLTAEAVEN